MAVGFSNLTSGGSGTNATSYSTASVSPALGGMLLVAVETDIGAGTPTKPTVSGLSGTWAEVVDCYFDQSGTQYRLTVFRCTNYTGVGALTVDYAGATQGGASWSVDLISGVNTSSPIVQSAKSAEPGSASVSVTVSLSSLITAGNKAWAVGVWEANETGTSEGGWTTLGDSGHANPSAEIHSMGNTGAADSSATISWTTSTVNGAVILEIRADTSLPFSGTPITVHAEVQDMSLRTQELSQRSVTTVFGIVALVDETLVGLVDENGVALIATVSNWQSYLLHTLADDFTLTAEKT
ncbi:MAG TPA: hypothetical protein VIY48_19405 [Candidatus Paceibacterota bacterium]